MEGFMAEVKLVLGIEIEGNKLLLTEDAAKQLYLKLKEVFEDKKEIHYVPYPYPVYVIPQPVWWYQPINTPVVISQPQIHWYNTSSSNGYVTSGYINTTF
jgi:hypothetical protein